MSVDNPYIVKRWKCVCCGHENRADRKDCVICGHEPVLGRKDIDAHSHCEECHARIPAGRAFCDICQPRK